MVYSKSAANTNIVACNGCRTIKIKAHRANIIVANSNETVIPSMLLPSDKNENDDNKLPIFSPLLKCRLNCT